MSHRHDAAVERMARLTFALLGATQYGSNPWRSASWVQANVEGYPANEDGKDGAGAFKKALRRDVKDLRQAGVPITMRSGNGTEETMLRVLEDDYRLPEVSFTPEEAMILGLAGGVGQQGGLSQYSQTGWTKIAAAGASRAAAGPGFAASSDLDRLDPEDFRMIVEGLQRNLRITFQYTATPTAEPHKREMDPWGLVTKDGRVYLVGFDVNREAPRSFRIIRVSDVKLRRTPAEFRTPTRPLGDIVDDILRPADLIDAVVRIPEGTAVELSQAGTPRGDGLVDFHGVSLDWLTRTAIGYAPEVEIVSPPEARQRVAEMAATVLAGTASASGEEA